MCVTYLFGNIVQMLERTPCIVDSRMKCLVCVRECVAIPQSNMNSTTEQSSSNMSFSLMPLAVPMIESIDLD